MPQLNNQIPIADKVVLSKTANSLFVDANQQVFNDVVNINARLSYIQKQDIAPGSYVNPGGDVFYDNFTVSGSTLPGTGTLAEKVVQFVSTTWGVTVL